MADQRDGSETHSAVAAIRLLMLTGCQLSEIQKLRWEYVNVEAGELRLLDSKIGGRAVPLAPSAVRLLANLPRDEDNPWMIAGKVPGSYLTDLQHPWRRICTRAELPERRIVVAPTVDFEFPEVRPAAVHRIPDCLPRLERR